MSKPPAPLRVGQSFEEEFPETSALASECIINLLRTSDLLLAEMARWLRPYNLSPTAAFVIAVIEGEPLTPREIGARILVTSGTMTTILDTLEKRGLVRRAPHPTDRRSLLVEITEDGRAFLNRTMPQIHAMEREWAIGLQPAQQAELVRALGIIQERIYALRDQPFVAGGTRNPPGHQAAAKDEPTGDE